MEFDTQPQSQGDEIIEVQTPQDSQPSPNIYGRLIALRIKLKNLGIKRYNYLPDANISNTVHEIHENEYLVGRAETSNLLLVATMLPDVAFNKTSKSQFKIEKDVNDIYAPVYITDMSLNGTFLNGGLIGTGKKRILSHRDHISIVKDVYKVFTFERFGYDRSKEYPETIQRCYFVGRDLGSGACGVVRLIQDRKTCDIFAMKCIKRLTAVSAHKHKRSTNDEVNIQREIQIMRSVDHPCVIKSQHIQEEDEYVYMVLEFMDGGNLLNRIISNGTLPEPLCKLYFYQMAKGLEYLHKKGITHRDLKPDNILLKTTDTETCLKISDFGLSKLMQGGTSMMRTTCGTPNYVAPEIVRTQGRDAAYTNKVDVWSMGVVLYTMLSGTLPFKDNRHDTAIAQIIRGKYDFEGSTWRTISPQAKGIVRYMMTYSAEKRPSIEEVLKHPWLRDATMIRKAKRLMYPDGPPPEEVEERPVDASPAAVSISTSDKISFDQEVVFDQNENMTFEFTPPAPKRKRVD